MRIGRRKPRQDLGTGDPQTAPGHGGEPTKEPNLPKLASLALELKAANRSPAWIGLGWAAAILFSLAVWLGLYLLVR